MQLIEQSAHVGRHHVDGVRGRVVRLVTATMAAAIDADDPVSGTHQRLLPSSAQPVELIVRCESVHEHHGWPSLGAMKFVKNAHSVAVELHPRRYATPSRWRVPEPFMNAPAKCWPKSWMSPAPFSAVGSASCSAAPCQRDAGCGSTLARVDPHPAGRGMWINPCEGGSVTMIFMRFAIDCVFL